MTLLWLLGVAFLLDFRTVVGELFMSCQDYFLHSIRKGLEDLVRGEITEDNRVWGSKAA